MNKIIHIAVLAASMLTSGVVFAAKPVDAASAYSAKVYASSLNVRSEPAESAAIVGSLKNGAVVTVTDEQHGWMKVKAGSVSGWVAGYYLKRVSGTGSGSGSNSGAGTVVQASARVSASSSGTATVTANSLRIRGGPGTGYNVIGSLKAGDSVTVLSRQSDWARIRTAGGETGWVSGQYITAGGSRSSGSIRNVSAKPSGSIRGKLIVIDPGHGGSDPGMVGTTYTTMEKDLTLQTSFYVRDYLTAKGARVEMTRTRGNQKPTLARRVQIGHSLSADAFVSVHYNSSPKKVSGTLTFFYSESDDLRLARSIENRLGQGIGLRSNGLSYGNYHILRENRLPAVLVELGFLSNPSDESIVRTSSYQKKAAKAIADGLADYFGG
ncbi:cell wall hydrolase [Paenibacillus sp. PK3_47]|uniref:N-acetylmuramoyl-L-alanine amidase n=1 Tax=Paenibacillus sp. PK3_47 TaxID=2072642 RepID=UPI00201E0598|nr:N-acetylmuramoyl-L-alanine amidase [Paenibacillus sp. PK3_47]UQZ33599.1 cell wall hydrolase [Paenibacillus sp. PK3_47]